MLLHEIKRGSWGKVGDAWFVWPPKARRPARLDPARFYVEEHDNGTITVTPSIQYSTPDRDDYWHGYLVRGVWKEQRDG